jgi:2'-5' RNA ligase
MTGILDTLYFAALIKASPAILERQTQVCSTYKLVPRAEFHLTFGFIGKVSEQQLRLIGERLRQTPPEVPRILRVEGLGGIFEADGIPHTWEELGERHAADVRRVFWWAVHMEVALIEWRRHLEQAISELALPFPSEGLPFSPHVTVGSAGPHGDRRSGDTLWDVHSLPKGPNISRTNTQESLEVSRLHLTSVAVHPESLVIIG